MSKGYIIGGGGSTKLYACIGVTYPSGSTCTCTNGTKTLKAKDTSGTAIFNVPSTGTWTVTATNGDKTASKSVSITAEGQTVVVSLAYDLQIFASNEGMALLFNGKSLISYTSMYSITDEKLSALKIGDNYDVAIYKIDKVDLTNVKTLVFDGIVSSLYGGNYSPRIGCWSNIPNPSYAQANYAVATTYLTESSTRKEYTVDVSSLSGEYYIGIAGNGIYDIYNIIGRYD